MRPLSVEGLPTAAPPGCRGEALATRSIMTTNPSNVPANALQLLDELRPERRPESGPRVATCVNARHPVLRGRVLVRWPAGEGEREASERWLPCLQQVVVRAGDRVLVSRPVNAPEEVVVGVLDGFARRPEAPRRDAGLIELEADERLSVRATDGTPLVEVHQEADGPVVRVLSRTARVKLPGALDLEADSIRLKAGKGAVSIAASEDVAVDAEMIRLNSPKIRERR